MCRLYGLHANEPTRVECSLVHAQNALISQGVRDAEGLSHGHGWGLATYPDGWPKVEKKAWAAWHGEHFRKAAARAYGKSIIAHVRRATVGPPRLRNTHPFTHGQWAFAHNGTIPNFDAIRPRLLDAMDELHRSEIKGSTDSEHVFRYLLTLWEHCPARPLMETMKLGIANIVTWTRELVPSGTLGLNVLWSDGRHMVGTRINRSLWYLERDGAFECPMCRKPHIHHEAKMRYRAAEVASEPITQEAWRGVPNGTVFTIDPDMQIHFEPLIDVPLLEDAISSAIE